jgi:hypothetical protein
MVQPDCPRACYMRSKRRRGREFGVVPAHVRRERQRAAVAALLRCGSARLVAARLHVCRQTSRRTDDSLTAGAISDLLHKIQSGLMYVIRAK